MGRSHHHMALNRRALVVGGSTILGTVAFSPKGARAAVPVSPVMATLSDYMAGAWDRPLPDEVVEKAKHHVLDTFAAMISVSELPPARAALNFARDYAADSTATIAASRLTANPMEAALVNGMLAHSDETDDSNEFSQSHPGCAVMLLDRTASFAAAHDKPRMDDPAVLRQRAKVQLIEDEELEKLEPARQAIVEITLNDGTVLRDRVTAVRGTVDNPMPRDEIIRKASDLCEPIIGKDQTAALVSAVFALESLANVRTLRGLLQKS